MTPVAQMSGYSVGVGVSRAARWGTTHVTAPSLVVVSTTGELRALALGWWLG